MASVESKNVQQKLALFPSPDAIAVLAEHQVPTLCVSFYVCGVYMDR